MTHYKTIADVPAKVRPQVERKMAEKQTAKVENHIGEATGMIRPERKQSAGEKRMEAIIDALHRCLLIGEWKAEWPTLRLAQQSTYTPDFWLETRCGRTVIIEIKGPFEREDSTVKFRFASRMNPEWLFVWVKETKQSVRLDYWLDGERIGRPHWSPI